MRRLAVIVLIVACASAAWGGRFGLGLGLGIYKPADEGSSYTPIYNLHAYYWATKHVVPSLRVGYARYTIDDTTFNYLPVIPGVTYHFRPATSFDPYVGGGVVYARKWWTGPLEERSENTWGLATHVGMDLKAGKSFGLGLGVEYVVPDAGDFDSAYPGFLFSLGVG